MRSASDLGLFGLAGLVLAAQATVVLGGGLAMLAGASLLALLAASGGIVALRGVPRAAGPHQRCAGPPSRRARLVALGVAIGLAALHWTTGRPEIVWAGAVVWLVWLWLRESFRAPTAMIAGSGPTPLSSRELGVLAGLGVLSAAFALCVQRPDADDAFYLGMAVAWVEDPAAALWAEERLHGIAGVALPLPVYRVHALEPLLSLAAWLTPLRVLDLAHVAMPALAAFAIPFAHARLLRILLPDRWLAGLLVVLALLLVGGGAAASSGNFGFVRLHQGKGVLVAVMLPLILALALEYAARPGRMTWLRLAAAQVVAVGLSATALWLAPVVSGIGLLAGLRLERKGLRNLFLGVLASLHPVGLGLAMAAAAVGAFEGAPVEWEQHAHAGTALARSFGDRAAAAAFFFVLTAAWAAAPNALARRLAAIVGAIFLVAFWGPFVAPLVGRYVTGIPTYWRVFWILPFPALLAMVATAPFSVGQSPMGQSPGGRIRALAWAGTGVLGLALVISVDRVPVWSDVNHARLAPPGWKIPGDELAALLALRRATAPDDLVVAPPGVARWLPTLEYAPTPLVIRHLLSTVLRGTLVDAELARRATLTQLVAGQTRAPAAVSSLVDAIRLDPLAAVCLRGRAAHWPELRVALRGSGLVVVHGVGDYQVWARPGSERLPIDSRREPDGSR